MLTVITGAAGFIGRALAARMTQTGYPGTIRLIDRTAPAAPNALFETRVTDLGDPTALADAVRGADTVIHLAAMPGGAAESDPTDSRRINLNASLELIDQLGGRKRKVRLIYASTIAVFGADLPPLVDDATAPAPATTYGAHKLMVEVALADAVRRGGIDAVALRLPGVVARPPTPNGLKSSFMSDVFHAIRAGDDYTLPVGPDATMWMMSAECCADALLHAACLEAMPVEVLTLPALRVRMDDLVAAIATQAGRDPGCITYRPEPAIENLFGRLPMLVTPAADAAGFVHDGDVGALVARVPVT